MKILAIGGGSMGQRRLRDLAHLNDGDVLLYEPDAQRCEKAAETFEVQGFTDLEKALAEQPEAMSVSTPPALHDQYVLTAIEHGMHVFSELPFALNLNTLEHIAERAGEYDKTLGVSCTIRYYPPFRLIRDLLEGGRIGRPLYLEYSLGNYLPDWHPYEDYRKFYASGRIEEGGAGMDMILHEMNAIQWFLGSAVSVYARMSKISELEIGGPDTHDILITFEEGAKGFFHHDVIERGTAGRHIRIAGSEGTLEWHQNLPAIRLFEAATGSAREIPFSEAMDWQDALEASREVAGIKARQSGTSGKLASGETAEFTYESCYLREMRHFIEAAQGKYPYTMATVDEELHNLRVFHAIVESSEAWRELPVGGR